MIYIFFLLIIYYLPTLWVKFTLSKYDYEIQNMPYTGLEFGKIILKEKNLNDVEIKGEKNIPDHYNLKTKSVVVEKDRLNKKSLTSITVICHEIGHAIQHKENYEPLVNEQKVKKATKWISNVGSMIFFIGIPSIIASGSLPLIRICVIIAFLTVIINIFIHLMTLNVEFDASFKKAMPIIKNKIPKEYHKACKSILKVCAFTYLVGAMTSFLNLRNIWLIIRLYLFKR